MLLFDFVLETVLVQGTDFVLEIGLVQGFGFDQGIVLDLETDFVQEIDLGRESYFVQGTDLVLDVAFVLEILPMDGFVVCQIQTHYHIYHRDHHRHFVSLSSLIMSIPSDIREQRVLEINEIKILVTSQSILFLIINAPPKDMCVCVTSSVFEAMNINIIKNCCVGGFYKFYSEIKSRKSQYHTITDLNDYRNKLHTYVVWPGTPVVFAKWTPPTLFNRRILVILEEVLCLPSEEREVD